MNEWLKHLTFANAMKALVIMLAYGLAILFLISVVLAMFGVYS